MKILVLSDLHQEKNFPKADADALFLLGDIPWKTVEEIDRYYQIPKFGVLGNHDRWDTYKGTGIVDVHGKVVTHNGFTIAGFGGAPRYNRKENGQYTETECADFMDTLQHADFFLAHSNPAFEKVGHSTDSHRGFEAFGHYIKRMHPFCFVHGHLHESYQTMVGNTHLLGVYLSFTIILA